MHHVIPPHHVTQHAINLPPPSPTSRWVSMQQAEEEAARVEAERVAAEAEAEAAAEAQARAAKYAG